jgi:hypothetical protein
VLLKTGLPLVASMASTTVMLFTDWLFPALLHYNNLKKLIF